MKLLAIDPGEKCGWAHGVIAPTPVKTMPGPKEGPYRLTVTGHGITALKPMALKLGQVCGDYDVVIYENFRLSAGKARTLIGSDMQTSQFIGMVRYIAWLNPRVRLKYFSPSDKETALRAIPRLCPDIQAILDTMPKSHDDAHDGDALLHLFNYYFERFV